MSTRLLPVRRIFSSRVSKPSSQQIPSPSSRSFGHHLVRYFAIGGIAGCTVTLTGYAIYHFSGAKKIVDTVRPAMALLGKSRENLAREAPGPALAYLRAAAKVYVASVPFGGFLVDRAFDEVQDVVEAHSKEATVIITKAYDDISRIIQQRGNEHTTSGAIQVVAVARHLLTDLVALGSKAGQPLSKHLGLETRATDAVAHASVVFEAIKSNAPSAFERTKNKVKDMVSRKPNPEREPDPSERQPVLDKSALEKRVADVGAHASAAFESVKSRAPSAFERIKNKAQDVVAPKPNTDTEPINDSESNRK